MLMVSLTPLASFHSEHIFCASPLGGKEKKEGRGNGRRLSTLSPFYHKQFSPAFRHVASTMTRMIRGVGEISLENMQLTQC